jgi:ornithine cyclodeaminase/alanine dehydrogenase-like protein (mu-crystallin family)
VTLILGNDDVQRVLNMPDCLAILEQAYREQAKLLAINGPRTDMYLGSPLPNTQYVFKAMEGGFPGGGVAAIRLNSDVIRWSEYAGVIRKDKEPVAAGKWVGLVLLFSTQNGEPLAIMPDGVMQRMRVGATNGLAARYLARSDAEVYGLLGSGWQAGAQLMAVAAVHNLRDVRVFSPNPEHRRAFAEEWSERLGLQVRAVDLAEEAVMGADVVGTATNAVGAVVKPEWLRPGIFVTCVKSSELGPAIARCDRVVVHTRHGMPHNYLSGLGDQLVACHDPLEILGRIARGEQVTDADLHQAISRAPGYEDRPELNEVIAGVAPGRERPEEITAFINNIGLGIQFAALGSLAYRRAKERGLGREVPTDWFLEDVHP